MTYNFFKFFSSVPVPKKHNRKKTIHKAVVSIAKIIFYASVHIFAASGLYPLDGTPDFARLMDFISENPAFPIRAASCSAV